MRHLNNGTDHRHSKSCCDQSSPARRTIVNSLRLVERSYFMYLTYFVYSGKLWVGVIYCLVWLNPLTTGNSWRCWSTLWVLMAWCWNTRPSTATLLIQWLMASSVKCDYFLSEHMIYNWLWMIKMSNAPVFKGLSCCCISTFPVFTEVLWVLNEKYKDLQCKSMVLGKWEVGFNLPSASQYVFLVVWWVINAS